MNLKCYYSIEEGPDMYIESRKGHLGQYFPNGTQIILFRVDARISKECGLCLISLSFAPRAEGNHYLSMIYPLAYFSRKNGKMDSGSISKESELESLMYVKKVSITLTLKSYTFNYSSELWVSVLDPLL